MMKKGGKKASSQTASGEYAGLIGGIAELLEAARRTAARTVNALMTATYWEIGRRIVEFEQQGEERARYGEQLLAQLSVDLTSKFGRGFGVDNLQRFRSFFLNYPLESIYATLSRKLPKARSEISQTPSGKSPGTASILSTVSIELANRKSPTPSSKSQPKNYATALRNSKAREAAQRELERTGYGLTISELTAAFPLPWSH